MLLLFIPSNDGPFFWNPFLELLDLPGFTRSVFKRDHALITPESHVFGPLPDWYSFLLLIFSIHFLKLC
jgi:(S)-ureidoglycine aminohydrolase